MNQKVFINIMLVIIVVVLVGVVTYFIYPKQIAPLAPSPTPTSTSISNPTSATNIKVLYPNGGERFNFYQPITIKWENNQKQEDLGGTEIYFCKVDPDLITPLSQFIKDNTVCFGMIAKQTDSVGINTISWNVGTVDNGLIVPPGYRNYGIKHISPGPGNYKIEIVNYFGSDKSIIKDMSDSSFNIIGNVTPSVDLKVNNSNDQIQVKSGEKVRLDWTSKNATKCLARGGIEWQSHDINGNFIFNNPQKPISGNQIVTVPETTYQTTISYDLICNDDNNYQTLDYVFITVNP